MSFDPKNYPPNWLELVAQVRARSGDKCELCSVSNGAVGARDRFGNWHEENSIHAMQSDYGRHLFDDRFPAMIRIVLTTHHACDCDKRTCVDVSHFQHLCQRCHLNLDRDHHLAVQAANREAKRLKVQPRLLEVAP